MQFDILNELVTGTVSDLFANSQFVAFQSKQKVRELEGLIKLENSSKRALLIDGGNSHNDSFDSRISRGSSTEPNRNRPAVKQYKNVAEWMKEEAPKRLTQSYRNIGLEESLLKNQRKPDLQKYIEAMSVDDLNNQKKKVKNELRCYDNDFNTCFKRQPNHQEKQPFRPLYVYYKKLKEHLSKRGVEQISQQKIEQMIRNIKTERKELRDKIEEYQKEFERTNNRRIRYVRDITPIDYEYKRYKELKTDLLKYEEMLNR